MTTPTAAPRSATLACDGYGFDPHPRFRDGGLVVQSHGEHGTRFLEVSRTGQFTEAGYYLGTGTRATDARWASRQAGERVVYALDQARGITVLRWLGPVG